MPRCSLFVVWYRARRASRACCSTNDDTPPPPSSTTRHALFLSPCRQICCPVSRDACTSLGACRRYPCRPGSCWACPSTCGRPRSQVRLTFSFFAVLMLLSVNMEFTEVAHRLWAEVCAGDISRMRDAFVRVAWNLGEAFLLGLAIRRLERAVRFPYFLVLLKINSCHVAGPFVAT